MSKILSFLFENTSSTVVPVPVPVILILTCQNHAHKKNIWYRTVQYRKNIKRWMSLIGRRRYFGKLMLHLRSNVLYRTYIKRTFLYFSWNYRTRYNTNYVRTVHKVQFNVAHFENVWEYTCQSWDHSFLKKMTSRNTKNWIP